MNPYTLALLLQLTTAGVTLDQARGYALEGKGQPTWRIILAVGVPAGGHWFAAPVYPLRDPPRGTRPGYYQVHSPDGRRVEWKHGDGPWRPMPGGK